MIDIDIVKVGNKCYSIKCNLLFSEGNTVTAKIIGLDLVEPTSSTSFKKLKSIFHSSGSNDVLSRLKYPYIYDAITKKLIQKYKMKVLNI